MAVWIFTAVTQNLLCISLFCFLILNQQVIANPVAEQKSEESVDWVRGEGKTLEIRLRGKIARANGKSLNDLKVQVLLTYNRRKLEVPVTIKDGEFESWLPVGKFEWYYLAVCASDSSGDAFAKGISRPELRDLAISGLDIELQPSQLASFKAQHDGKPVAATNVRVTLSNGTDLSAMTNEKGVASVLLPADAKFRSVTSWKEDQLMGGFSFYSRPELDAEGTQQVVELFKCKPRELVVVNDDGDPISGVKVVLQLAAMPGYKYFGFPDGASVVTDESGMGTYDWIPDVGEIHCYAEIDDVAWAVVETVVDPETIRVTVRKRKRQTIQGTIECDDGNVFRGAFAIQLHSFQDVVDGLSDMLFVTSDQQGKFSANVLEDATYCMWVEDERWVSKPLNLIPYLSTSQKVTEPKLSVLRGHEIKVRVLSEGSKKPIPNTEVRGRFKQQFSWRENGRDQSGSSGPRLRKTANEKGEVTFHSAPGRFEVSARGDGWQTDRTVDVSDTEPNEVVTLLRKDVTVKFAGKLLAPADVEVDLANAKIEIQAIDGESGDKFTLETESDGAFEFESNAKTLGVIVYTADQKFAGTSVIKDANEPVEVNLQVTKPFEGQIVDDSGQPVAGHNVWARVQVVVKREFGTAFRTTFSKRIAAVTDASGRYRFANLPCESDILIGTDTVDRNPNQFETVAEPWLRPEEDLGSSSIKKLRPSGGAKPAAVPFGNALSRVSNDCQLNGYHLAVIGYDRSDDDVHSFVDQNVLSAARNESVSRYLQLTLDSKNVDAAENVDFVKKNDWPAVAAGEVFLCVFDPQDNEVARESFDVSDKEAVDLVAMFLKQHAPKRQDAKVKWDQTFALAKETNRRVWVRTSGRYCRPCFSLTRWIDENRELLEKEFVLLKIDVGNDLHGEDMADRLAKDRLVGIPFFLFYDAEENLICDSYARKGNIGFMSGVASKRHFRGMLEAACKKISPSEMDELLSTLDD